MAWRVAGSLDKLVLQINKLAPLRSTVSDGAIGDTDHANRASDHNPWCDGGVVTARDITDDPGNGADMGIVAEALRQSKDPRIKYVIFQGRMFSSYPTSSTPAWTWRPYSGVNAHEKHMHISVQCDGNKDSAKDWEIGGDWFDMATKAELREVIKAELEKAVDEIKQNSAHHRRLLATGKDEDYNRDNVNLKKAIEGGKR